MLKRLSLFLVILLLAFCLPAFADMTDKATLGGIDSSGQYHWRVDSTGKFKPGTTAQNDIGDSTHRINDLYSAGKLYFKSSLQAIGAGASGVTTLPTSHASFNPVNHSIAYAFVATHTMVLQNGYAGQILTIAGEKNTPPTYTLGTLTITPTTCTQFTSITFNAVADSVTLLYIDDTYGWVVIGGNSYTLV